MRHQLLRTSTTLLLRASTLSSMAAALTITTTTDSAAAAQKLREAIVAAKLTPSEAAVREETIRSFYWWDGAVQNESEIRLSFDTNEPWETASKAVLAAHNYDVPMVVAATDDARSAYLKGVLPGGDAATAEALANSRLVACAQVSSSDLAVKTVAAAVSALERKFPLALDIEWVPIQGNQPYLDWLDTETKLPKREL